MQGNNKILKLLILVLLAFTSTFSKDSRLTLLFNVNANLNIHSSNFKELIGFPICCTKFTNGNGIAPSFNFGLEYKLKSRIIGENNSYGLTIGYNDLSAQLKQNEFIANKVYPDRVEKVYADFIIDSKISSIQIQNYFLTDIPFLNELKMKLFLDAGFLLGGSFIQKEVATSPTDFVFENLKRSRSEANGDIPKLSSLYLALGVGLSYPIFDFSNIKVFTDLSYCYSFTNFISNDKWSSSQLKFGLTGKYNLQKINKEPIIPELPKVLPLPVVPEPPKPDTINIDLFVKNNERVLYNNDTVTIERNVKEYIENYGFLPVVFYEKNSLNFINTDIAGQTNQEKNAQKDMKNQIISYLTQNSDINTYIISFSHNGENEGIADERANEFIKELNKAGIDKSRLTYKTNINRKLDNKREELTLDNQKLEFEFSNGNKLLQFNYNNKIEEKYSDFLLNAKSITECTAGSCNSIIRLFTNGVLVDEQLNEINKINVEKYNLNPKNLSNFSFIVLANDSKGNSKQFTKNINFKLVNKDYTKIVNLVKNVQSNESYEQYILAFTEFDKSKLIGLNNEVVNKIKDALSSNKKVELLALTDNLGTEEYNKSLAQARAKSALNTLNLKDSRINVTFPESYIFSNNHPYGRLLNRAIIIRIYPHNN